MAKQDPQQIIRKKYIRPTIYVYILSNAKIVVYKNVKAFVTRI